MSFRDVFLPPGCQESLLQETIVKTAERHVSEGLMPHPLNDAPVLVKQAYDNAFINAKDK